MTTRQRMERAPRDHEVELTAAYLLALEHLLKKHSSRWGKDSIGASLAVVAMQPPEGL